MRIEMTEMTQSVELKDSKFTPAGTLCQFGPLRPKGLSVNPISKIKLAIVSHDKRYLKLLNSARRIFIIPNCYAIIYYVISATVLSAKALHLSPTGALFCV